MAVIPQPDPSMSADTCGKADSLEHGQTSERVGAALKAAAIGLWEWDVASNRVRWSEGVAPLFGVRPERFEGTLDSALASIHSDDREHVVQRLNEAAERGEHYAADFRTYHPGESMHWLAGRGEPVFDEQGRVRCIVGAVMDITEQKRAEFELAESKAALEQTVTQRTEQMRSYAEHAAESESRYRTIGETLPYGVWMCDADGRVRYLSDSFLQLVGMTLEQARGCPFEYWCPESQQAALRQRWAHCIATGAEWDHQYTLRDSQGREHTLLSRGRPVRDEQGRISSWVGINLDITDRTDAERLLAQREEQLAQFDRLGLMGELASGLAHELNQPLAAITSYAEGCLHRLSNQSPDLEALRFGLDHVVQQAERAGRIIRHLREFARVGEPMYSQASINELIDEVMELARGDLNARGVSLTLDLAEGLPDVRVGRIEIQQVLLNLIRNAIEAMAELPAGDRRLTLRAALAGPDAVRISVRDTGPGLADEQLAHIFDPFYTTKDSGMGVGLNLCETLVHHHRGKLWAERNDEGGLTLHLQLPVHPPGRSTEDDRDN
jgi:PAS domain S-box-containing protein